MSIFGRHFFPQIFLRCDIASRLAVRILESPDNFRYYSLCLFYYYGYGIYLC